MALRKLDNLTCNFEDYVSGIPPVKITVNGIGMISGSAAFIYQPLSSIKPEEFHSIVCRQLAAHIREEWPSTTAILSLRKFYSFIKPTDFKVIKISMAPVPAGTAYCLSTLISYETPEKNALIHKEIKLCLPLGSDEFRRELSETLYDDL